MRHEHAARDRHRPLTVRDAARFEQELETSERRRLRAEVAESGRATAQLAVLDRARQVGLDVRRAYLAGVLDVIDRSSALL